MDPVAVPAWVRTRPYVPQAGERHVRRGTSWRCTTPQRGARPPRRPPPPRSPRPPAGEQAHARSAHAGRSKAAKSYQAAYNAAIASGKGHVTAIHTSAVVAAAKAGRLAHTDTGPPTGGPPS